MTDVPEADRADVERIVRRDFPAESFEAVMRILDGCTEVEWVGAGRARIQLAVLKLAHGNESSLRSWAGEARCDYRDVLAPAESPNYLKKVRGPGRPPGVEEIIAEDLRQYRAWLDR